VKPPPAPEKKEKKDKKEKVQEKKEKKGDSSVPENKEKKEKKAVTVVAPKVDIFEAKGKVKGRAQETKGKHNRGGKPAGNKNKVWGYEWMRSVEEIVADPRTYAEVEFAKRMIYASHRDDQEVVSQLLDDYDDNHDRSLEKYKDLIQEDLDRAYEPVLKGHSFEAKISPIALGKNIVRLKRKVDDKEEDVAFAWMLSPTYVVLQNHFVKDGVPTHLTYKNGSKTVELPLKDKVTKIGDPKCQEHLLVFEVDGVVVGARETAFAPAPAAGTYGVAVFGTQLESLNYIAYHPQEGVLTYRTTSVNGDCMAPIVSNEGYIIGFHAGKYKGVDNHGFAVALNSAMVKDLQVFH